ncbi:MAG: (Fe-S)-binding protein [Marinilabiliaceae bacterium]|nr:(Fe-S)-binding protein [Marinilabiliaceae bacterium]
MVVQIVFFLLLVVAIGLLYRTSLEMQKCFRITKPVSFDGLWQKRLQLTLKVVLGQSKIMRKPFVGMIHALVFWGFLVITIGTLELVVDGLSGQYRSFSGLERIYEIITASGDIFAVIVLLGAAFFLVRRMGFHIKRFYGIELTRMNKQDANIALLFILFLMVSLLGLNTYDLLWHETQTEGWYPVSNILASWINGNGLMAREGFHFFWWGHILLIFIFANYLPYSKHFHVFMSLPNVFLSSMKPLAFLPAMPDVTKEVKLMLTGDAFQVEETNEPGRFGVKDVEDVTSLNYLNALTCTQCGRCTEVCPANITGKELSPRKIFVDLRNRMMEKGPFLSEAPKYHDDLSLVSDYITNEELWACTTCNACAQECPLNISHPNLIMDMRRYLVLEEGKVPEGLNAMFANIENNGAPWKFSPQDRLNWTQQ